MYATGTVLRKKQELVIDSEGNSVPAADFKPKGKDDVARPHPYNQVKVLGASPVVHGGPANWSGIDANGVIVQPMTEFAMTVDQPFGLLQRLYDIESEPVEDPEDEIIIRQKKAHLQPTPEMQFDAQRPQGSKKSPTRVKTPMPSDGDPGDPSLKSPLE